MKKAKGSTKGMVGKGAETKKPSKDKPPGMYGGRAHTAMGGGTEKPRRGFAMTGGDQFNANCA